VRLWLTLTFNPRTAMVITDTHAKAQGKRSLGSKVKSGNRWMDGHRRLNFLSC